jgi:hypothetical protein
LGKKRVIFLKFLKNLIEFKKIIFYNNNRFGQIGDGTSVNRLLPTLINITTFSKKNNFQHTKLLITGECHTCAFFDSPYTCFLIEFNESSVCSGNGKK